MQQAEDMGLLSTSKKATVGRFSHVFELLRRIAAPLQLGATCVREAGEGVTHVVATDVTDKTRWAKSQVRGGREGGCTSAAWVG